MELTVEESFLDPRFGVKYIGYPTVGLFLLAVVLLPFARVKALGVLMMALGYVVMGVGFIATVLFIRLTGDR
jgi:hypothetical protein